MLFKPLPVFAANDSGYCGVLHSVLFRQLTHKDASLRVALTNFYDLLWCQLGYAVFFATWLATLCNLIVNVIQVGSSKKMERITTKRCIALVENVKTCRYSAMRKYICYAMRVVLTKVSFVAVKAIAVFVLWAKPQPTIVRTKSIDSAPKGRFDKCFTAGIISGIMGLHRNLPFCAKAQDAANVAGLLLLVRTSVILPQVSA